MSPAVAVGRRLLALVLEAKPCPHCAFPLAVHEEGALVCLACEAGCVPAPAVGAVKPGRVSCLVPGCGRSWDPAKVGHGEMVCGRHWRLIPPAVRARRREANRLVRLHPGDVNWAWHADLAWDACKRAAVTGGVL